MPRLVLASASPARARLLDLAGFAFDVVVSGVEEEDVLHLPIGELVAELARRKALAVAASHGDAVVIGCDSMFEMDGSVFGKPADADEARGRWRRMRGRSGTLHTGHCVVYGGSSAEAVDATVVHFADVSDAEIDAYAASGEPMRVAGGFTLDGIGSPFVDRVEGNPGTVIGISLPVIRALLGKLGLSVVDLWR